MRSLSPFPDRAGTVIPLRLLSKHIYHKIIRDDSLAVFPFKAARISNLTETVKLQMAQYMSCASHSNLYLLNDMNKVISYVCTVPGSSDLFDALMHDEQEDVQIIVVGCGWFRPISPAGHEIQQVPGSALNQTGTLFRRHLEQFGISH